MSMHVVLAVSYVPFEQFSWRMLTLENSENKVPRIFAPHGICISHSGRRIVIFYMLTIIIIHAYNTDMLSGNIISWLVLLMTLATVSSSEHYHIVPVDSIDLCHDYRNGTCFTLEQLVKTDVLSGENLTLSFLPGDHVLTEPFLIRNFSHVHITGQNTSTPVVRLYENCVIRFVNITELSFEYLGFVGANVAPPNVNQSLIIIDSVHNVYIKDCYFTDFKLLDQAEIYLIKMANTQTATIESTCFRKITGPTLHIETNYVNITHGVFTRNDGCKVYIQSNNTLINNTEFNNNNAINGGAVEVISGTVVITRCNFTNNKFGGAIHIGSGSNVSISKCKLINNEAKGWNGGATKAVIFPSPTVSS